jgi:hypothetical protein
MKMRVGDILINGIDVDLCNYAFEVIFCSPVLQFHMPELHDTLIN